MSPFKVFSDTFGRLTDSVEPVAEFDAGLLQATSSIGIKNKESFDFFIFSDYPWYWMVALVLFAQSSPKVLKT